MTFIVQKTNLNVSNQNPQIVAPRIFYKLPTALKGVFFFKEKMFYVVH